MPIVGGILIMVPLVPLQKSCGIKYHTVQYVTTCLSVCLLLNSQFHPIFVLPPPTLPVNISGLTLLLRFSRFLRWQLERPYCSLLVNICTPVHYPLIYRGASQQSTDLDCPLKPVTFKGYVWLCDILE